jgi:hypothetical protein
MKRQLPLLPPGAGHRGMILLQQLRKELELQIVEEMAREHESARKQFMRLVNSDRPDDSHPGEA